MPPNSRLKRIGVPGDNLDAFTDDDIVNLDVSRDCFNDFSRHISEFYTVDCKQAVFCLRFTTDLNEPVPWLEFDEYRVQGELFLVLSSYLEDLLFLLCRQYYVARAQLLAHEIDLLIIFDEPKVRLSYKSRAKMFELTTLTI